LFPILQAQRTLHALPLLQKAQRAILLSGTPALSRPGEIMTQLQALLPKAKIKKRDFEERYCEINQWNQAVRMHGYFDV
jgi:SWI/SNF-related matrix-associated actin-dependent regulator 1 of chromatin subfamily A